MLNFPEYLTDRYHRFRHRHFSQLAERYEDLMAHGQSPDVMIISCCDSRVDPETIFGAMPGELFVVRNVANLVPPFETGGGFHGVSAALEFAVLSLKVKHIIVMGHERCGGIGAVLAQEPGAQPDTKFVYKWVSMLSVIRADTLLKHHGKTREDLQHELELAGTLQSIENLRTFPFITEREGKGELTLHASHFNIAEGKLSVYDEAAKQFVVV